MKNLNLNAFVKSYLYTASWIACDSGENTSFTKDAKQFAKDECQHFIKMAIEKFGESKALELLTIEGNDLEYLAAHDFYLTRNHHGTGFWDKGNIYGEGESLALTELSHKMGETTVYHVRGNSSPLTFD